MTSPRHGLPPLLALLTLAGCGGSSPTPDIGGAIGDALICGLRNCTESATLNVDEISPRFTAMQAAGDGHIVVEGDLGKSANVLTTVLIAPDERLSASVDGGTEVTLASPDGKRLNYAARIAAAGEQPVVRVVFTRGGTRHVSQVTLPAGFTVLQPTGSPLLTRSGAALPVRLSQATVGAASASASGNCSRSDGSSFELKGTSLGARTETSVAGGYRLEPAAVDDSLNAASRNANNNDARTPAVTRCDLVVTWTAKATGSVAPTMNGHGSLTGLRTASHPLSYDARL
ncbi:hypothetical protein ACG04Q_03060 [Roseateles sp. DXS20W]|uniref:Lipoprotein n=1 Tax=Pelomonas lactea TaxID=3299030 RepID=A0ABW7GF00_9BURK